MEATASPRTSVLFVCLGNICRSPLAEGVFRHLVEREGLEERFAIESAGTGGWHVGEPADARSRLVAEEHGVVLDGRARKVADDDFRRFDVIVVMDHENLRDVRRLAERVGSDVPIRLLREFDPQGPGEDVPDPYYGGSSGFEAVYQMVARSCEGLLDELRAG